MAERTWSRGDFEVKEGLKPGSKNFQYFFVVSEGGKKKCNYCVWIDDDHLDHFSPSKSFEEIVSSQGAEWNRWVQGKLDQGDFRNMVLKIEKGGAREIDLKEMEEKLKAE